jgi:hypothetical protein
MQVPDFSARSGKTAQVVLVVPTMISAITRARIHRVGQTFREVYAETGSLPRTMRHMARFIGLKITPLVRYGSYMFMRFVVIRRLRQSNAMLGPSWPTIAVRILGGVGDYIVIARFLRDIATFVEPAVFDVYSNKPALVKWIFAPVPGFRSSYDEAAFLPTSGAYTVMAQISQFVIIHDLSVAGGALQRFPRLQQIVRTIQRSRLSIESVIAEHPRLDNFLAQKAVFANRGRRDYLHLMAGIPYGGDKLAIEICSSTVVAHGLDRKRYITVHNGYDPNMVVSGARATKCYPHFGNVIEILRLRHPDLMFVHTPVRSICEQIQLVIFYLSIATVGLRRKCRLQGGFFEY